MFNFRFFQTVVMVLACLAAPLTWAQTAYPEKPIRIVVPYPAGGATDTAVRTYLEHLPALLGQQILVEYRVGGGTNIGAAFVAQAEPDGYILYVANFASNAVNKWLYRKLSYDPDRDFAAAAMLTVSPQFLVVHPSVPARSVKDLVALAKQSPGKLTYGSPGIGSPNHIAAELFRTQTGIKAVHVPYKGSAASSVGLLSGETDYIFDATAMTFVHAGKLRVLAVAHSKRWPTEPTVPSMAEQGFPSVVVEPFFALVAPAKTPVAILQKINDATRTVAQRPDVAKKLAPIGLIPVAYTLKETADFLREQGSKWASVVKASGAVVD